MDTLYIEYQPPRLSGMCMRQLLLIAQPLALAVFPHMYGTPCKFLLCSRPCWSFSEKRLVASKTP